MKKLATYFFYLLEYLKNGDISSIFASVTYLIFKRSHAKDRIIKSSVGYFFCRKNTNDFQFANYHYEWGVKKFVLNRLNEFDLFIDGGSCVGEYCILLSKFQKQCFAFEPIAGNYLVMQKNLELNNLLDKVKTYPFGLSNYCGSVNFVFNPVNTGASHISNNDKGIDCVSQIRTFDSLLQDMNLNIDVSIFFKLDVEGMEKEALEGATEFIRTYSNITFIMEDKHSGRSSIQETLNEIAIFEYGIVDKFNFYAKKIRNYSN